MYKTEFEMCKKYYQYKVIHEFPACCCLLAKGGSLIFLHDFKGGPLIIKPYSRGGPRKNIQLKN